MNLRRNGIYMAAAIISGFFSTHAVASPIIGVLNIAGGVSVSMSVIDFLPVGGGTGIVLADAFTNTGSFAVLNTGNPATESSATIKDLTGPPFTGAVSVPAFLSGFTLAPNIQLNLTFVNPSNITNSGSGCSANTSSAAAGNACALPGSPFNLQDVLSGGAISAVVSLGLSGNAVNTTTGEVSPFTGVLSTQVDNTSYESILATLTSGGTFQTTSRVRSWRRLRRRRFRNRVP
jgi:hypothetical protein